MPPGLLELLSVLPQQIPLVKLCENVPEVPSKPILPLQYAIKYQISDWHASISDSTLTTNLLDSIFSII